MPEQVVHLTASQLGRGIVALFGLLFVLTACTISTVIVDVR